MQKLTTEQVKVIEDHVNDASAIALLEVFERYSGNQRNEALCQRWVYWRAALEAKLGITLNEQFFDVLTDDLMDWEHNGSMYVHDTDAYSAPSPEGRDFELGRWRLGKEWDYTEVMEIAS